MSDAAYVPPPGCVDDGACPTPLGYMPEQCVRLQASVALEAAETGFGVAERRCVRVVRARLSREGRGARARVCACLVKGGQRAQMRVRSCARGASSATPFHPSLRLPLPAPLRAALPRRASSSCSTSCGACGRASRRTCRPRTRPPSPPSTRAPSSCVAAATAAPAAACGRARDSPASPPFAFPAQVCTQVRGLIYQGVVPRLVPELRKLPATIAAAKW